MTNLRIAGPTPFYPGVYDALQKEMISHRGSVYQALHQSVVEKLKPFFGTTKAHLYILTSSGTGGMEAGVCNFFNPGDKVIAFSIGVFGERWIRIAKAFGLEVIEVRFPMGQPVDMSKAEKAFKTHSDAKGVHITHNETSAGVLNKLKEFARLANNKLPNRLILVDSISVLGATRLEMDEWGIDYIVTSSQKAWSAPPGLCMIAVSERAYKKMFETANYRYYFDLRLMDKYAQKNETPATPAVGSLYGLEAALSAMHKEGKEAVFKRHLMLRDRLREGVKKLNMELLVSDEYASPTVTAIYEPQKSRAKEWSKILKEKYDLWVSGGKGELEGKIIRVAHMGYVTEKDIEQALDALEKSLKEL